MNFDNKNYLECIYESTKAICDYTFEMEETEFYDNAILQDAVLWNFNRIGWGVKQLDQEFRQVHPDLPWEKLEGMRVKFGTENHGIDMLTVWATVHDYIPQIHATVKGLLKSQQ